MPWPPPVTTTDAPVRSRSVTGNRSLLAGHVLELGQEVEEREPRDTGRAVAVLGHDHLRGAALVGLRVVDLVTVEEDDDVGVLLERAALAEVREHGPLVGPVLELAVELRERDAGALELAGEDLEPTRDLRDLDLAVLRTARRARRHQLEVVDDDQRQVTVPRLGPPGL